MVRNHTWINLLLQIVHASVISPKKQVLCQEKQLNLNLINLKCSQSVIITLFVNQEIQIKSAFTDVLTTQEPVQQALNEVEMTEMFAYCCLPTYTAKMWQSCE